MKKPSSKYQKSSDKYSNKSKPKKSVSKSKVEKAPLKKKTSVSKRRSTALRDDSVRLNKFIANSGICSRREADVFIASGVVTVNGEIITEMGYKVAPTDTVKFDGETIKREQKRYFLINKPSGFTLREDKYQAKDSIYKLIQKASAEWLSPVGKLNKEDCGLVLFTNDQDLTKKLTHPNFKTAQLFHVVLDKNITEEDLNKLVSGMYVDNHLFSAEEANFVTNRPRNEIGIKVFYSKNKIVKFMLGKLGYKVERLDCLEYAGLTKKDLPRGKYRSLTTKEIGFLKML